MKDHWNNISVKKISKLSNVSTATVDRVLHKRKGVSKHSVIKVNDALKELKSGLIHKSKKILFFCQSGNLFNEKLNMNIKLLLKSIGKFENIDTVFILPQDNIPTYLNFNFLKNNYDGLIIIAAENSKIKNLVQNFIFINRPVITLTTDLSDTDRTAYVGNNQVASGSTVAKLLTSSLNQKKGDILIVLSQPYRCQQDRELGFKKIIRYEYPKFKINEVIHRIHTTEDSYKTVKKYIKDNGPPLGIYNVAGGNEGVAEAIKDAGHQEIIFIGHELNNKTHFLLNTDQMLYVIGHDEKFEIENSILLINNFYNNKPIKNIESNILIHTKHNCSFNY